MPSDSISSFDGSASRYTAAPSLEQKRRALEVRERGYSSADRIESPEERGERLNPANAHPKSALGDKAVKIARAGRFVIYALALPPFLLLYTLPKVAAANLFPLLFAPLERGVLQGQLFLQKMMQWLSGNFRAPFRNRLGRIAWGKWGIEKRISSQLDRFTKNLSRLFEGFYRPLATLVSSGRELLYPVKERGRELFASLAKRGGSLLRRVGAKVEVKLKALYSSHLQPTYCFLLSTGGRIGEFGLMPFRFFLQRAALFKHSLRRLTNSLLQPARERGRALLQQLFRGVEAVMEGLTAPHRLYKRVSGAVRQRLEALKSAAVERLLSPFRPLSSLCKAPLISLKKRAGRGFSKFKGALHSLLPFIAPLERESREILDRLLARLKKGISAIRSFAAYFSRRFLKWLFPLFRWIALLYRYLKGEIHSLLGVQVAALLKACRPIVRWGAKAGKFFLLLAIAAGLVIKYWVEMLFEMSDQIAAKR